ncbi:MAG: exodeoxyribonuclease VII large subunit [Anaerolineales bacterium]|jgi:exodeoxyribonuclease VII large subunit
MRNLDLILDNLNPDMNQLMFFEQAAYTVTELTRYLRDLIERDPELQDIWVIGEVSNLSQPKSGHLYFTIKDTHCSLRCVMWKNAVLKLPVLLKEGDEIEVHGSLNIYESQGQYQLYADRIRNVGEGILYRDFLALKSKLEKEGLFDLERKRAIPPFPECIGIVTSPTGAAIQDIFNTLQRRFPSARLVISPTQVQGTEAPAGIISALESLNKIVRPDVIILARGGGSIEDLWAFNDEGVARAIAGSQAPVICGVGHETDFTIADFVADLRAPTPTAAAEMAAPNREELLGSVSDLYKNLSRNVLLTINDHRLELSGSRNLLAMRSPLNRLRSGRQSVDELTRRSVRALIQNYKLMRVNLTSRTLQLIALSPKEILKRGYAILSFPDKTIIRTIKQVSTGDELQALLHDGKFGVTVSDRFEPDLNKTK